MGKVIDMHVPGLQRRGFLGYLGSVPVALSGSSLLGLTACGGSSDPTYPTKITFVSSTSPATDADKAKVFTDAKINVTYSDGAVIASSLAYKEMSRTGAKLKTPAGADVIAGGFYKPDGVTPINDTSTATVEHFYSDCVDGQSLLKLSAPTVTAITGNALFLVVQYEYKSINNAGTSMYGRLPSPIGIYTMDQNKTTGDLAVKYYYNVPTAAVNGLWITCGGSLSPWNTHLSSEEYEPDAWFVKVIRDAGTTTVASLAGWSASQLSNFRHPDPH